jgi:hypothetical protein
VTDELRQWLARAKSEYAERKGTAERRVVRWEWATSDDRSIEPFYFERGKYSRGKPLSGAVVNAGNIAYGLDAEGRTVVERQYCDLVRDGDRWCYETFYEHRAGETRWVLFDYYAPDKNPIAVGLASYDGERLMALTRYGTRGASSERYQYIDGRLARIDRDNLQPDAPRPAFQRWSDWYELRWSDTGELDEVQQWDPFQSRSQTIYRRPEKGETLKDLSAKLEARLIASIPLRVKALGLTETAYAVVLAYDGTGNDMFPPVIGIGLARERDAWISSQAEDAKCLLWNPAEYQHQVSLDDDEELLALCAKVNQQISMKEKWSTGRKLLGRVAASLRTFPWHSLLIVTDDFVVYAVDFELGDVRKKLREAARTADFERWRRSDLVP